MAQIKLAGERVDISDYGGKDTLLGVLTEEYEHTLEMVLSTDEEGWHAQTPCAQWEVRDLLAHLVDVAESYLGYFTLAREEWPTEPPRGMKVYAGELSDSALRYRDLGTRHELIARLKALSEHLFGVFAELDEEQWAGWLVPHKYVGPVPSFMMCTFQLMDYSVHNWDFRQALGLPASVNPEAADLLVPFMFGLMGICFDAEKAGNVDLEVQVSIAGRPDDDWTVTVTDGAFAYRPGKPDDPAAMFRFDDAEEFALDCYQRFRGGSAEGDPAAAETFRSLFFTI